MHHLIRMAVVLLSLWLTTSSRSAEPRAHLTAEAPFAAALESIDQDGNITFRAGEKLRVVAPRELAFWGRYRDSPTGPQFLLTDGSVIRADLLKLDQRWLVIGDATGLGRGLWEQSTIPRQAVRAIVWQPPAGKLERDLLMHELSSGQTADRLLLVGAESLSGRLISAPLAGSFLPADADAGRSAFSWQSIGQTEPLDVPAAKVRAIQFAGSPLENESSAARPPKPTLWIGCRDGSVVACLGASAQGGKLALKLAVGGELATVLGHRSDEGESFFSEVTWVHAAGGNCHWLSDEKTLGYRHIPYLTVQWPYHNDRTARGGCLRAGGAVFPKGLGMHAASRLAYEVSGYRRFEAEIAIDETSGSRGSAVFKVLLQEDQGDWTPAYESPVVRGGDEPLPVSIDLKGAARLALIVEFADRGDELDQANWLSARLLK